MDLRGDISTEVISLLRALGAVPIHVTSIGHELDWCHYGVGNRDTCKASEKYPKTFRQRVGIRIDAASGARGVFLMSACYFENCNVLDNAMKSKMEGAWLHDADE
jgi:hypothetical protein